MEDPEFDKALIASAFQIAAESGWPRVSVAAAAQAAGLPLEVARRRFPTRAAILLRLGSIADQAVLAQPPQDPTIRERLFDVLMRRFDAMQPYREGIAALLRSLPANPPLALLLALATRRSMAWMLEAAGVSATGCLGQLRVKGLTLVWLHATRCFVQDSSPDLSATMAALDKALDRAAQFARMIDPKATPTA